MGSASVSVGQPSCAASDIADLLLTGHNVPVANKVALYIEQIMSADR